MHIATALEASLFVNSDAASGFVCVCHRFFSVFISFWLCIDTGSHPRTKMELFSPDLLDTGRVSATENLSTSAGRPEIRVERTLAMVKPDAIHRFEELEDIVLRCGFTILNKRRVLLTPEQANEFYAEHFGKLFFPSLIGYMSSGPVYALALARENAVAYWRELIGPTNALNARTTHPESLRARFGTDDQRNGLHGSDSTASAEREIRFFFPESIVEPIAVGQKAEDYLARAVNPTLLKGLTELSKKKPSEPIVWLADWLMSNNPNKPLVDATAAPLVVEP